MQSTASHNRRMPWFLPVLLVITVVYLLVEICFASFLVELLGSQADHDAIERAEHAGRLISGIALALAIWGFQIPRLTLKRPFRFLFAICLSASISITAVYYGERWLIDEMARTAPSDSRQHALRALAVREELFVASPSVLGIEAPAPSTGDATWSAFRGLFPFISLYQDDVLSKHEDGVAVAVAAGIASSVPNAAAFDEDVLGALFIAMESRYEAYREAVAGRDSGIASAERRIRDGWERNVQAMRDLNIIGPYATNQSIRRGVPRLRSSVQERGIPVPNNWNPTDQETFQRAAWGDVMPGINKGYNDAIKQIFGHDVAVAPTLHDYESFLRNDGVQAAMRLDLGLRTPGSRVLPDLDGDALAKLHAEYVSALSKRLEAAYLGDATSFRRGEEFHELGESAVRALIVPPIALSLSLLGAAVHLVKFLNYLAATMAYGRSRFGIRRFLLSHPRIRFGSALMGAVAIIVSTYTPASAIVDSSYYREATARLETGMPASMGMPISVGLDLTISMQSVVAPAGNAVRQLGLFSPIESYLGGDVAVASGDEETILAPFPMPRPEWMAAEADIGVPLPRPRPQRQ